jgi:hypothetical protein
MALSRTKQPQHPTRSARLRQSTNELRRRIQALDGVLSGTVHVRTKVCGKPNCRCAQDPDARHGPYIEWSHRQDNRLVHRILTPEQAELVQRAIANYRTIQDLLGLWERKTIEAIFPEEKPKTRNV